ncbi:MAG: hypothetical protein CMM60_01965, partial [Rhodospirillaceae bacterium]|nr:hypothetical protein [Rhodospirillaceae bacterium]
RVAAEMVPFPRRWHGGMISANQEAIWGMSVYRIWVAPPPIKSGVCQTVMGIFNFKLAIICEEN